MAWLVDVRVAGLFYYTPVECGCDGMLLDYLVTKRPHLGRGCPVRLVVATLATIDGCFSMLQEIGRPASVRVASRRTTLSTKLSCCIYSLYSEYPQLRVIDERRGSRVFVE